MVEWSAGWASGLGTLSSDGLTLTRVHEHYSDAVNTLVSAAPYRNVPASGAVFSVVGDARSAPQSTLTSVNADGVQSAESYAAGGGTIASGSPNSAVFGAGSVDVNCPGGLVLGGGGAWAPHATSIGNWPAEQHSMMAESHGEQGKPAYKFKLEGSTANATPVDLFCNVGGTIRPVVPADQVWLIRCFIVGLVSNSPGSIGNVYTRELQAVGKPTGQVGATVSNAIASDAGFTGSATISIDGSGNVKVTVTGIAATTIKWSAHLEITPAQASA